MMRALSSWVSIVNGAFSFTLQKLDPHCLLLYVLQCQEREKSVPFQKAGCPSQLLPQLSFYLSVLVGKGFKYHPKNKIKVGYQLFTFNLE